MRYNFTYIIVSDGKDRRASWSSSDEENETGKSVDEVGDFQAIGSGIKGDKLWSRRGLAESAIWCSYNVMWLYSGLITWSWMKSEIRPPTWNFSLLWPNLSHCQPRLKTQDSTWYQLTVATFILFSYTLYSASRSPRRSYEERTHSIKIPQSSGAQIQSNPNAATIVSIHTPLRATPFLRLCLTQEQELKGSYPSLPLQW